MAKQLKSFQNNFGVYIGFATERVNILVLIPNIRGLEL